MSQFNIFNGPSLRLVQTIQFSSISLNLRKTIVFIDANVDRYQSLLDEIKSEIEVQIIDGDRDGSQLPRPANAEVGACIWTPPQL
ncbi:DUF4347 domain-containing protein [Lyngbya sp. PCC 8106]|uniref:DUF4347 domain-containing protein n=1 Tax=Lyngbya sp. (strain PCC 8106) TaxID=313612 RepID=UPI0000EA95DF|nr:DUF4347 domain-containing protein [Lyngbya sp. PCC 8106]EAW35010.1 hypothetical protein L8106_07841 [Lyngbya sp. PCC 8106]